ncbi:MAG: uroporphyrinogen-III synthase [Pseudomonadota bacterium]
MIQAGILGQRTTLTNKNIWLTRPAEQIGELRLQLEKLGAHVLSFPLLTIRPVDPAPVVKQRLMNLDQYDLVFFVSTNAARIGLDVIVGLWPQYPAHILNFAVGPSTAAEIESYALPVCYPQDRMSSEAMLELPELQNIGGKKSLIIRGVGGREILAEGLRSRGALVDYAELYERVVPVYTNGQLRRCVQQHTPDAIVVSSAEALDNLRQLYEPLAPEKLSWQQFPLCVTSDRLAEHAFETGYMVVTTMAGATDVAIVNGLMTAFGE